MAQTTPVINVDAQALATANVSITTKTADIDNTAITVNSHYRYRNN